MFNSISFATWSCYCLWLFTPLHSAFTWCCGLLSFKEKIRLVFEEVRKPFPPWSYYSACILALSDWIRSNTSEHSYRSTGKGTKQKSRNKEVSGDIMVMLSMPASPVSVDVDAWAVVKLCFQSAACKLNTNLWVWAYSVIIFPRYSIGWKLILHITLNIQVYAGTASSSFYRKKTLLACIIMAFISPIKCLISC